MEFRNKDLNIVHKTRKISLANRFSPQSYTI